MNTEQLKSALAGGNAPTLLDVRLGDDFEAAHIPGASNPRVFEVSFLEQVSQFIPDRSKAVVVYGFGGESKEAEVAAEKLTKAGFEHVAVFPGGLDAWRAEGGAVEGSDSPPAEPSPPEGKQQLDLAESRIEWVGRNLLNKHWGTLGIKAGHLEFEDGRLTGGEMTIDMNEIACTDLAESDLHDVLIAHLKDDDFFDVGRYPTAAFRINEARAIPDSAASEPNIEIVGDLTLRGNTHPVTFSAVSGITPEGIPAAQAAFAFDRTRWGVIYGSGKFFRRLAGHLVSDMIELQLRMVCQEAPAGRA